MVVFLILLLIAMVVCVIVSCRGFSNGWAIATVVIGYVSLIIAAILGIVAIIIMNKL